MADLSIRDENGIALYRVNARMESDGRYVCEPRSTEIRGVYVPGAFGDAEQRAIEVLNNPLMAAVVRSVDGLEQVPDRIVELCLATSSPREALSRMGQTELGWLLTRFADEDVRASAARHEMAMANELRAMLANHVAASTWWEGEVRDA